MVMNSLPESGLWKKDQAHNSATQPKTRTRLARCKGSFTARTYQPLFSVWSNQSALPLCQLGAFHEVLEVFSVGNELYAQGQFAPNEIQRHFAVESNQSAIPSSVGLVPSTH
jgi:hypothetical protein